MLLFVSTLIRIAVAGMPNLVARLSDVEGLTAMRSLADASTAVTRLTNVVRARGQRLLLDRSDHGGLLSLPYCRFGNDCRFGGIPTVF
jgi:hypothetical protein